MSEDPHERPIDGLDDVYADRTPPPDLEARVMASVRQEAGWPDRSASATPGIGPGRTGWLRLAASLLLFGAGWAGARVTAAPATSQPAPVADASFDGPAFVLLLWETVDFDPGVAPETIAQEYAEWSRTVAAAGTLVDGNELSPERVVTGVPTAGHDATDFVGGYFVVEASRDEALRLAAGHPHVGYGGWIEVAPIVVR